MNRESPLLPQPPCRLRRLHIVEGDSALTLAATGTGEGTAVALMGGEVDARGGHDNIAIAAWAEGGDAIALMDFTVRGGWGNDQLTVFSNGTTMQGGIIDGVAGNNNIHLITEGHLGSGQAFGGDGNDIIRRRALPAVKRQISKVICSRGCF